MDDPRITRQCVLIKTTEIDKVHVRLPGGELVNGRRKHQVTTYSFELPEPTGTPSAGNTMSGTDVLLGEDAPYRYLDPDDAINLSQRLIAAGLDSNLISLGAQ